ncbi:Amino acid adenylation domain-containing protein [Saccharothrix espanaensis DSM 44229]|uniref:Amino acid adenylation domain-containing protein n=1 Tax=Saccharothrix espanaensis (strain ATCC 51144 / DSM 44229 / JCM 9112 / NBRC 15066 / NRRL 15764) TaxID=1179773 RepID=K0K3B5_SACES|nr:Amino acid adenylation domain-containing protein [Saccharothrix espanaensis DSM 44229]
MEIGSRRWTYAELEERALALAKAITAVPGPTPTRIALVSTKKFTAYAGWLAIQRVGAGVLPLNPEYPRDRNLDIAQRAGVTIALVDPGADVFAALPKRFRPTVIGLDATGDGALPDVPADPELEAYVLFTSGSTGQPKGVPILQRGIAPYVGYNIGRYEVDEDSRLSQVFGLTFDASTFDMFVTWGAGATLVVPDKEDLYRPVDFIVRNRLTHWFSVPSVIRVAEQVGNLPRGQATTLRHSLFGAEPVTVQDADMWHEVAPRSRFHNLYGPTEVTITCTEYEVPFADRDAWARGATVPIGRMYPMSEGVVLGEDGRPAQDGELCLRGPQRFDGYLDPRENAGRFVRYEEGSVAVPHDGTSPPTRDLWYRTGDRIRWEGTEMVHRGRLDHQVKIMGHRVELGEVEAALYRHPDIVAAGVVAVTEAGETRLWAGYTGTPLPGPDLDLWLRAQVPAHMVPDRVRHLDTLPLNDNGKTDRTKLAEVLG